MKKEKHRQFGKSVFLATVAIFVVFGLVFGTWGAVYAAQDSLPGDLLYSVKLAQEGLQLALASDTQARIRLLTSFVDRRVKEAATLVLLGQPVPDELQTMMDSYLEELLALTPSQDEPVVGIQKRPRDQDQGRTGSGDNPPSDAEKQNREGKEAGDSASVDASTLLTAPLTGADITVNGTHEISATQVITPGVYGPGPCTAPDCGAPLADEHSPGPYSGMPPGPEIHEGYGPGSEQGQATQQPSADKQKQAPPEDSGNNNSKGK